MQTNVPETGFHHQHIPVNGREVHVVSAGSPADPVILFLHGFPEDWSAFRKVMEDLQNDFYVVSIDLPGIGTSDPISSTHKREIARSVRDLIDVMKLKRVTLVGHDAGGMVVYAFLKLFPGELARAVIINVVIPGVEPWTQVKQNPMIWHFRFHNIPDLPETLVKGREKPYFDYYFNTISKVPAAISEEARLAYAAAYSSDQALKTGFDWYRSFNQDEKDNAAAKDTGVDTPVLYLRGDSEYGKIEDYLTGFRDNGLRQVEGKIIPNSGHYAPEEAPDAVADALRNFIRS